MTYFLMELCDEGTGSELIACGNSAAGVFARDNRRGEYAVTVPHEFAGAHDAETWDALHQRLERYGARIMDWDQFNCSGLIIRLSVERRERRNCLAMLRRM